MVSYCEELHKWQEHFGLKTVAETEMALWTFDQLVKQAEDSSKATQLRKEFDGDMYIQRRRAAMVLGPFLRNNGPLALARILVEENAKLAGKLAAEEYERLLGLACKKYYGHPMLLKRGAAENLLDRMARDKHISITEKVDLRRVWEIRNSVVHPDRPPTATEVEWMLDQIEKICARWGPPKC